MKDCMNNFVLCAALLAAAVGPAQAERADSLEQMHVMADTIGGDFVKSNATAEGNVVVTRGTMVLKGAKLTYIEDAEGKVTATVFAPPGGLATYRQKRDGGDLWVEGEAERVEFNDK